MTAQTANPTTRTIKQTIKVFPPEAYRYETVIKETLPKFTSVYSVDHSETCQIPVDSYAQELFDGFLFIELDKLQDLVSMYWQSEYSSNCMFGDILLNQLNAFKNRLEEAAYHINRTVGRIGVVQTRIHSRAFDVGTIIDAGYYENGMVTDSKPFPLQRENNPNHSPELGSQEGGAR